MGFLLLLEFFGGKLKFKLVKCFSVILFLGKFVILADFGVWVFSLCILCCSCLSFMFESSSLMFARWLLTGLSVWSGWVVLMGG